MAQNETQYEKYLRNGKDMFETYCSAEDGNPIMLPRAPQQKYVDLYPEDQPGCSFENDRNQQLNYEAEVIVYRALEKVIVGKPFIVLHSFEFTHFQYHLGDTGHDKRKCQKCKKMATNREGECDFIVIASNYFVVIEVKNMGHIGEVSDSESKKDHQMQVLAKTFQKSLEQRKKMVDLIKRFCKRLTVLQFTVYPNFQKRFSCEFQLSRDQKSTIIFKEDIDDFSNWWNDNVSDFVLDEPLRSEFRNKHEDVRNLLLAIWSTDKTIYDKSKCSLSKCIMTIDEQLRSGRFSFRSNNPEVIPTSKIVKDFLGVDNLTKQQYDLINSEEKFLWINGPAGAGKTVVLMAKILELVLSDVNNKVVFFCETCVREDVTSSDHIHKALIKAGVWHASSIRSEIADEPFDILHSIKENFRFNQVEVIMLRGINDDKSVQMPSGKSIINLLRLLQGHGINVFFDDIQAALIGRTIFNQTNVDFDYEIVKTLFELSRSGHVWVTYDTIQTCPFYLGEPVTSSENTTFVSFLKNELSSLQLVSLSKNLRNTSDLSSSLLVIRNEMITESIHQTRLGNNFIVPQNPGHYIHGPKGIIHVLQNLDKKLVYDIFAKEIDKLFSDNMIEKNDVGCVCNFQSFTSSNAISLTKNIVDGILYSKDIKLRPVPSTYSKEWPAVIALQMLKDGVNKMRGNNRMMREMFNINPDFEIDVEDLYLAMSRARVKFTVIMFPVEGFTLDDCSRMKNVLDKLGQEGSVEIKKY